MCTEGVILRDKGGIATLLKQEARHLFEAGPPPLSSEEIRHLRYTLTDAINDLHGASHPVEALVIAQQIANLAIELFLGHHRQWTGYGKWALRALRAFDPPMADRCESAILSLAHSGERLPLLEFAQEVLDLEGGPLFEGYRLEA